LKIKGIEHIAINVKDIRKSKDFYGRILGFELLEAVDCGEFYLYYYRLPGNARLELFDYHGGNKETGREESEVGLRHLAFQVEDVAAHEKLLKAAGVPITLSTCDLPNLASRVLLFLDPNGVTIEFCEKL
jgi:lactoylglutathione lyase